MLVGGGGVLLLVTVVCGEAVVTVMFGGVCNEEKGRKGSLNKWQRVSGSHWFKLFLERDGLKMSPKGRENNDFIKYSSRTLAARDLRLP